MSDSNSKYQKSAEQLRQSGVLWWPAELSDEAYKRSIIPTLLSTQKEFICFLNFPYATPEDILNVFEHSSFSPKLFLKHLIVLTDFGGEMLQRVNLFFDRLFPNGYLEFVWHDATWRYQFKQLPISGNLTNTKLGITVKTFEKPITKRPLLNDVLMLLIFGEASIDPIVSQMFDRCEVHKYLGEPQALAEFIEQRYIVVSRVTSGSITNARGGLVENVVWTHLKRRLTNFNVTKSGQVPGITHRSSTSRKRETTFDIVVESHNQYVAIEISFQVTTNSVIERKGREAKAIFQQANAHGHKIAYVIDGAGNFQRHNAITNLCQNSHCTVTLSPDDLDTLCEFIEEVLS